MMTMSNACTRRGKIEWKRATLQAAKLELEKIQVGCVSCLGFMNKEIRIYYSLTILFLFDMHCRNRGILGIDEIF